MFDSVTITKTDFNQFSNINNITFRNVRFVNNPRPIFCTGNCSSKLHHWMIMKLVFISNSFFQGNYYSCICGIARDVNITIRDSVFLQNGPGFNPCFAGGIYSRTYHFFHEENWLSSSNIVMERNIFVKNVVALSTVNGTLTSTNNSFFSNFDNSSTPYRYCPIYINKFPLFLFIHFSQASFATPWQQELKPITNIVDMEAPLLFVQLNQL